MRTSKKERKKNALNFYRTFMNSNCNKAAIVVWRVPSSNPNRNIWRFMAVPSTLAYMEKPVVIAESAFGINGCFTEFLQNVETKECCQKQYFDDGYNDWLEEEYGFRITYKDGLVFMLERSEVSNMPERREVSKYKFFTYLYKLKSYLLMLENIFGAAGLTKKDNIFADKIRACENLVELTELLKEACEDVKDDIPKSLFEEWDNCVREVYADKCHHGIDSYEIENFNLIKLFLESFEYLFREYVIYDDRTATGTESFEVQLHGFNDYKLYFEVEKDAYTFVEKFNPKPYMLFEKENGVWTRMYNGSFFWPLGVDIED